MESKIKIRTKDRHVIHGTLKVPAKKTQTLAILIHGLTGHQNEHVFYNAAKVFAKKGIATFRFDLYSGEKGGRVLTKTTIATHAKDIDTVVNFFESKYKAILLIGHSLGGPSIMLSKSRNKVSGIVLWDSAHTLQKSDEKDYRYNKAQGAYILSWGIDMLISKRMFNDWKKLPRPRDLIKDVTVPVKVICAGKGALIRPGKEYFSHASEPKEFAIIKNASHTFDEEGAEEELLKETLSFVKKLSKKSSG